MVSTGRGRKTRVTSSRSARSVKVGDIQEVKVSTRSSTRGSPGNKNQPISHVEVAVKEEIIVEEEVKEEVTFTANRRRISSA